MIELEDIKEKVKAAMNNEPEEDDEYTEEQEEIADMIDRGLSEAMALGRMEADHRQTEGGDLRKIALGALAVSGLNTLIIGYWVASQSGVL